MPGCVEGASSDNDISGLFCEKWDNLYNSVPYVEEEMVKIRDKIEQQLCSIVFDQSLITVSDISKGIGMEKLMALRAYILIILLIVVILLIMFM